MTRHFFVCGTGRSGSLSIARFFSQQPNMHCLHEGGDAHGFAWHRTLQSFNFEPILKWEGDWTRVHAHYERLLRSRKEGFLGDVGMYLIPYTDLLLETYPDATMVCLKRDKEEVVESFNKRLLDLRENRARLPGPKRHGEKLWDCNYPTFATEDAKHSIELYWDLYYQMAEQFEAKYPDRFKVFPTLALNDSAGRNALLDFIGYPLEGRIDEVVHANKEAKYLTRWNNVRLTVRALASRIA